MFGTQTSRLYSGWSKPVRVARNVFTLKNTVPASSTMLLHQSIGRDASAR